MGARSTGPIAPAQLIEVVKTAAQTGAQVYCFTLFYWIINLTHIFYSLRFGYALSLGFHDNSVLFIYLFLVLRGKEVECDQRGKVESDMDMEKVDAFV